MLLLSYIYFISLTPLIKRVFQYHGAEHKVINAYENDLPLTVENVQKQTRLHYRCGSSFIIFTVIIGMFVYFLVPTDPLWARVINRILLIQLYLVFLLKYCNLQIDYEIFPYYAYLDILDYGYNY